MSTSGRARLGLEVLCHNVPKWLLGFHTGALETNSPHNEEPVRFGVKRVAICTLCLIAIGKILRPVAYRT